MTGTVLPVSTAFLLILSFCSALSCYSLRNFSRSRLDEICRRRGREERFGAILKRWEDALLAAELFLLFSVLGSVSVLFAWTGVLEPVENGLAGWLGLAGKWLLTAAVLFVTVSVLPWTVARVAGETVLYFCWPLLQIATAVMQPLLKVCRGFDKFVHRLSGVQEPGGDEESLLAEEIRTVVDESRREGVLESEAGTMIHRVMELQQEDTAAVMTPRTEMNCIPVTCTLQEARARLLEAGHSRMPVIGETTDDIIGILYAKDLLRYDGESNGEKVQLAEILREPFYVPETTGIANLLETMKKERTHLAIVVDEYGGVAGLVTMEDILEEIVGEIVDEYDDAEEDGIHSPEPGVVEVDARVHIDDLNEQFQYGFPEEGDFDTIGGFVFNQLGRIPVPGDNFTWNQFRVTVLDADQRKVRKLRIEIDHSLAAASPEET